MKGSTKVGKKHRLYYVTGSKGGVGKSLVATSLIFYLLENKKDVRVIDTDDSNPDVGRIYENSLRVSYIPLSDNTKSWGLFLNALEEFSSSNGDAGEIHVVVNGAARDNKTIEHNGDLLNSVFQEGLDYDFSTLWVISDSIDSVNLLNSYISVVLTGNLFVFRNLHFGEPSDFITFNQAIPNLKGRVNGIYEFPNLDSTVSSLIHREKLLLSEVSKKVSIGWRMLYLRWLNDVRRNFHSMNEYLTKLEENNYAD